MKATTRYHRQYIQYWMASIADEETSTDCLDSDSNSCIKKYPCCIAVSTAINEL